MRDLVLDLFDLIAVKLHDFVAVLADDMIMVRMLSVVRIVKLVVLTEIHFAEQTALGQEWQGAINRRAGN